MALLWMDGFDWLDSSETSANANTALGEKYNNADLITGSPDSGVTAGRGGGTALQFRGPTAQFIEAGFSGAATVVVGFAYKTAPILNATPDLLLDLRNDTVSQIRLSVGEIGNLEVEAANGSFTDLTDTAPIGSPNTWYYIELKVTIDNSSGAYELRVNGTNVLSDSSLDTHNSGNVDVDRVRIRSIDEDATLVDDLYILDSSGSSNNDFLGDQMVRALHPDADTSTEDWTLSAGSDSYALVDELGLHDSDTTYLESPSTASVTLMDYEDTSDSPSDIKGIQINATARVDAGSNSYNNRIDSNGSTEDGATHTVNSTSYSNFADIIEEDPDTSSAWSSSGLDALEVGVKEP